MQINKIGVKFIKMCEKNQELSKIDQRKWECAESNSQGRSLQILESANSILQYIGSDGSSHSENLVLNMLTSALQPHPPDTQGWQVHWRLVGG